MKPVDGATSASTDNLKDSLDRRCDAYDAVHMTGDTLCYRCDHPVNAHRPTCPVVIERRQMEFDRELRRDKV